VKTIHGCNNDGFRNASIVGMSSRALDGGLVGFGAGIAEKHLVGDAVVAEPSGQFGLGGNVVQIGNVVNLIHLIRHGLSELVVGVAECTRGNAGHHVEVFLPVRRVELAALATLDGEWIATIIMKCIV
jgi:hypothetical protein